MVIEAMKPKRQREIHDAALREMRDTGGIFKAGVLLFMTEKIRREGKMPQLPSRIFFCGKNGHWHVESIPRAAKRLLGAAAEAGADDEQIAPLVTAFVKNDILRKHVAWNEIAKARGEEPEKKISTKALKDAVAAAEAAAAPETVEDPPAETEPETPAPEAEVGGDPEGEEEGQVLKFVANKDG